MEPSSVKRRLTCILAADAVGYSQLMGQDEEGTIRVLSAHRAVIDGIIAFHEGRIVSTAGDSVIAEFSSAVVGEITKGEKRLLVDLSRVTYVDSATIGCFMDLYRQASAVGATLKLAGVQKRVETMLTMTGAQNFLELHADEQSAIRSFGS